MAEVRVGVVGVGNMGGRVARRLRDAGVPVVAVDRSEDQLAASGIPAAASLAALVEAVDVVLLSLPDSTVVESVVLGDDGIAAYARAGQVVVDLSTASPQSTVALHATLLAAGVELLDAGISGGAKAAEQGTLTLMVGGSADALTAVTPVLDHFSAKVFHMGPPGAGHVAKVLNNYLNGVNLAATAEAMLAARMSGLDLEQFLDVLNNSSGVNFATLHRFPSIVKGDYLEGGLTGRLMAKDLRLCLDHLARIGSPTFIGPACLAAFEVANAGGYGEVISNHVVDGLGDLAGGVRLQDNSTTTTTGSER
jgi:3-hydroxyisobutyrate dehydrogenase-like beta-hydroxyacid dehydrogenase